MPLPETFGSEDQMSVWENLVSNSTQVAGQVAGDALKSYTERLQSTQAATPPAASVPPASNNGRWIKIGAVVLGAVGLGWLIYHFATKKGK